MLHQLSSSNALFGLDTGGVLSGVAAWAPPEPAETGGRSRCLAWLASLEVRALFPIAAPRLQAGFAELEASHPHEPHRYLAFVGIDPHEQRRGPGRTLLAPVLEHAEQTGTECYLETPFPQTRAFYRRLGFEDTSELCPLAGAPTIWTMTRQPGSRSPALA